MNEIKDVYNLYLVMDNYFIESYTPNMNIELTKHKTYAQIQFENIQSDNESLEKLIQFAEQIHEEMPNSRVGIRVEFRGHHVTYFADEFDMIYSDAEEVEAEEVVGSVIEEVGNVFFNGMISISKELEPTGTSVKNNVLSIVEDLAEEVTEIIEEA